MMSEQSLSDGGFESETRKSETVRDYLVDRITSGTFKVGDQLPTERVLSEEFSCPRSVVRKALTILEIEGRIIRNVGRGTFVAPHIVPAYSQSALTPAKPKNSASPAELMEARMLVEPNVAHLAVQHATLADIRDIEFFHLKSSEALMSLSSEDGDEQFHRAIARATHNNLVISVFEDVTRERLSSEWTELKLRRHETRPERRNEVRLEHAAIVDAIRERDGEMARQRMIEHLLGVRRHLFGY
jgi:DNA-binding FadR family transcriptional regulator